MDLYVGSDPGKQGWVSWVDSGGRVIGSAPQPLIGEGKGDTFDRMGMVRLVHSISGEGLVKLWAIERQIPVGGRVRINPASAAVQFSGYGQWLGVFAALGIPHVEVNPKSWRKALDVVKPRTVRGPVSDPNMEEEEVDDARRRHRKDVDARRKDALANAVKRAQALWPEVSLLASSKCRVPSPDKAVSLLLAEYARREKIVGA